MNEQSMPTLDAGQFSTPEWVQQARRLFPALNRCDAQDRPLAFLDGPAGTQVPQAVIDAITDYLVRCNANRHGRFVTADETEAMFDWAGQRYAEFFGVQDPQEIVFGPNMTSLTFQFSRAISQTWQPGDEIVVTRLDHDANVSPWVLAARDRGVIVKWATFQPGDLQIDLDSFRAALSPRTKLVAFGAASNSTGGLNPIAEMVRLAHEFGALAYVDAVHLGPHRMLAAADWGADFVVCSAYKFFGPHVGILWGRRELLESIAAYKVRPASNQIPDKWMQGTQNHECIAGAAACVEYLQAMGAKLSGRPLDDRRACLAAAYQAIETYETDLASHFVQGLAALPAYRLYGVGQEALKTAAFSQRRVSTFSIRHNQVDPQALATHLGEHGILCWDGNYYALEISEQLGLEPQGMLRIGLVHYNTHEEVERLLRQLATIPVSQ